MRFRLVGADRDTGNEMTMVVDATDAAAASAVANRRGLLVERCDPEGSAPHTARQWAKTAAQFQMAAIRLLQQVWAKRYGRIALVTGPAVIVITAVLMIIISKHIEETRREINAQIDAGYRAQMKASKALQGQADDYFRQAAEKREQAAALRAQDAASDATAERQMTKTEAINHDPVIQLYLDRHPELRSKMLDTSVLHQSLDVSLNLLVSQGELAPSDVRYIQSFAEKVRSLPN
jgi:hypothetical protein